MTVEIKETNHRFAKVSGEYLANDTLMYYFYDRDYLKKVRDFPLEPNDVLLATYPRSGTTFTQRIISGLKFGAEAISKSTFDVFKYFPHVELNFSLEHVKYCGYETALKTESPRWDCFFFFHFIVAKIALVSFQMDIWDPQFTLLNRLVYVTAFKCMWGGVIRKYEVIT